MHACVRLRSCVCVCGSVVCVSVCAWVCACGCLCEYRVRAGGFGIGLFLGRCCLGLRACVRSAVLGLEAENGFADSMWFGMG